MCIASIHIKINSRSRMYIQENPLKFARYLAVEAFAPRRFVSMFNR